MSIKSTSLIRYVERYHKENINEIVRNLYVDRNMSLLQISEYLDVSIGTVHSWVNTLNLSRKLEL